MHTAEELDRTDFTYRVDGETVTRETVLPPIDVTDRVGVVMADGTDGLGAGTFVLAAVTAFYDRLRETKTDFFEYPDYYTFQLTSDTGDAAATADTDDGAATADTDDGAATADTAEAPAIAEYSMLDIYPEHKNVAVGPTAEQLSQAIVDRAIDVLLVPDTQPTTPDIDDITLASLGRHVDHCYLYGSDGQLSDAGFTISQPREPARSWFESVATSHPDTETLPRAWVESDGESSNQHSDELTQQFRALSFEDALARLPVEF